MRVRAHGSDGGQRGIRSIIAELGTDQFPASASVSAANPTPTMTSPPGFSPTSPPPSFPSSPTSFPVACLGIECLVSGDVNKAMQLCNRKG